MGRYLSAAVLLGVAAVSGVMALRPEERPAVLAEGAAVSAPVLSLRRVPELLAQTRADGRLRAALDAAFSGPGLGPAAEDSACLTVEAGGRPLYSRNPDRSLLPASNLKLLTALAALDRLGPATRFRTEVVAARPPVAGVVEGPVWMVGGADPLLATDDYAATLPKPPVRTSLEALADRVVAGGLREVRGGVIGDETRHDRQRYVPTWKPQYRGLDIGPMSALTVNDNFMVSGRRWVAAPAPATAAAAQLTFLLQARGVLVRGFPAEGAAPPPARRVPLAAVESPPLSVVVGELLRESDNLTAELLLKELGFKAAGTGTTAAGLRVARQVLQQKGVPLEGFIALDGSGLDRGDRVSCRLLLAVLDRAGPQGTLARGLPVAAEDGTLAHQFVGTRAAGRLRAKTGTLQGVVGLSGFAEGARGASLTFSLLANELPQAAGGRRLATRVGTALVAYPDAPPATELAP